MAPGLLEYDEIMEPEVKSLHPTATSAEPGGAFFWGDEMMEEVTCRCFFLGWCKGEMVESSWKQIVGRSSCSQKRVHQLTGVIGKEEELMAALAEEAGAVEHAWQFEQEPLGKHALWHFIVLLRMYSNTKF